MIGVGARGFASLQCEFETRVVGTDSDWAFEIGGFGSNLSFPDLVVIYEHAQFFFLHFGAESMGLARAQVGHIRSPPWLDVLVAVVAAFRAGMLRGISFHRDHKLRLGIDAPHRVHQVAGIMSAQLDTKLA